VGHHPSRAPIEIASGTSVTVLSVQTSVGVLSAIDWSPDEWTLLIQAWGAAPDGVGRLWSASADGSGSHVLVDRASEGADWR
jgi:hypothetical protein